MRCDSGYKSAWSPSRGNTSLCTCPKVPIRSSTTYPFVSQMCLPVLYKYWPLPTCMFFSLIVISLLLVIPVHSKHSHKKLSALSTKTSAPITPWLLSLNTLTNLQLIMTASAQLFQLTSYAPEVTSPCPKMSPQLSVHLFHLVTALTKYSKLSSTCSVHRLQTSLNSTNRLLEPFLFGALYPNLWKSTKCLPIIPSSYFLRRTVS